MFAVGDGTSGDGLATVGNENTLANSKDGRQRRSLRRGSFSCFILIRMMLSTDGGLCSLQKFRTGSVYAKHKELLL
jgi:hypothetical protein